MTDSTMGSGTLGSPAGVAVADGLGSFAGARVVLIGSGQYASGLPDVPAVSSTLTDLKSTLVTCCGLSDQAVRVVEDPATAQVIGEAIAEAADQATGLLLVYYVGHGLVSQDGGLHLAASQSEDIRGERRVSRVEVTALPYAHLRNLVLDSEARTRLVVLDCCFSGKAASGLASPGDEIANLTQVAGSVVLTSAGAEEVAMAPPGARHTAFTGALVQLLREGDPDGPRWLTVQHVYHHLASVLPAAGFPRPRLRVQGATSKLVLAPNPAYRAHRASDPEPALPAGDATTGVCPYKGLAAFSPTDEVWFRGRRGLVTRLVARLADRLNDPRPLLLTGASGSGKSSLLRAGLLPALARGELGVKGASRWPHLLLVPGADPVEQLAETLAPLLTATARPQPAGGDGGWQAFATMIRQDPDALVGQLRQALAGTGDAYARAVLIVDQFEEVFTLCESESDRDAFVQALSALAAGSDGAPAALVLLAVRADLYGRCTAYPELAAALEGEQIIVSAMTATQTREAIEQPAAAAGLDIEPGFVNLLLADLGARDDLEQNTAGAYEPGRLPLLAHALRETWQHRDGRTLTIDAYQRTGRIHGALAATADRVLATLTPDGQEAAHRLLLRLVRIGDGSHDTRRRIPRTDLLDQEADPSLASTVLDAFAAARLVTADNPVEITHEALLWAWPTLRSWIDNDRAALLVQQQLIDTATEWLGHHRDPSMLYTGVRLALARQWATPERRASLPTTSAEFLDASITREQEQQRQALAEQVAARRRNRRDRILAVFLAVLLAVSLAGGAVAVRQWQNAQTHQQRATAQQRVAVAQSLTIQAESLRATDPITALKLGLAAVTILPDKRTRDSLAATLTVGRLTSTIPGNGGPIHGITFTSDGRTLAIFSQQVSTLQLWDTSDRTRPRLLAKLNQSAEFASFSPDNLTFATSIEYSKGPSLWLWDIANPGKPRRLAGIGSGIDERYVGHAFSADKRTMVSATRDGTMVLWDITDRTKPQRLSTLAADPGASPFVRFGNPAFNPAGNIVAGLTGDRRVRLWDIKDRRKPRYLSALPPNLSEVSKLEFVDGGKILAVVNPRKEVLLWDVNDPAKPRQVTNFAPDVDDIRVAAFGPDGRTAATVGNDGAVRLWDITDHSDPQYINVLASLANSTYDAQFTNNGRSIATASRDGAVRLWDISSLSAIKANPIAEACTVTGGGLTRNDWQTHAPDLPYTRICPPN